MKILRIIARLNVGGPARHVVWLTKELQNEEFQSVLIAGTVPAGEKDMRYFADSQGVTPHFLPEMSRELSPKDIISLFKLYKHIRRERPDIIHTHTAKAGTIGRIAGFLYKWLSLSIFKGKPRPVKIVHTFHGHVFHSYYGKFKTRVFLTIERFLARFATDKIVVISRQQMEEINGRFRIGRTQQFAVVPLGIDLKMLSGRAERRAILRSEIEATDDAIVIGFVGRLTQIKNVSLLLETARLRKVNGRPEVPGMKFAIIGDGHQRASLEKEAASLGIEDLLVFLGNRDDPATFYAGLDIVALTSLNEGTPLSLIEGMAAGCPVISTGVGGVIDLLGEIIETADEFLVCERGIRVDSRKPKNFYNGLIYLAKNGKVRASLAERGQTFINEKYSKDRLVEDIKSLYRNLAAE